MPVEVGIAIPQIRQSAPATSGDELAHAVAAAEDAGFASVWVMEPHVARAQVLDPLATLSFAAARTTRIRLGAAVLLLPTYQPVLLARTAATLDWLSNGRLVLGIAVGAKGLPYEAFGARLEERGARMEEYIAVMRTLWTADEASSGGNFVRFERMPMEPKPVQNPLPLWFGAVTRAGLRRAARLGDGWIGGGAGTSAQFAKAARLLDELLEEEGRDPASFPVAKRCYVAIDQPQNVVEAWIRSVYEHFKLGPEFVTSGTADEVAAALAGRDYDRASELIIHPVGDVRQQFDAIAEHVLPALKGS